MSRKLQWLLALVLMTGTLPAYAQATCTLSVPTNFNFGVYDPLSATPAAPISGTVTLACVRTGGGNVQITFVITMSQGVSGSYTPRAMLRTAAPADNLQYNLYLGTVGAGTIWGNGTSGTVTATGQIMVNPSAPGNSRSFTLLGQIPASQLVSAGLYVDTIIVTATYN